MAFKRRFAEAGDAFVRVDKNVEIVSVGKEPATGQNIQNIQFYFSMRYLYMSYPTAREALMISGYGVSTMSAKPIW